MFVRGVIDTNKKDFSVREIIGETEYTKFMAKLHGFKYERMDGKNTRS